MSGTRTLEYAFTELSPDQSYAVVARHGQ